MEVPVPFLGAKSIMKDFVEWIEFLVDSVLAGIWLEGPLLQSRHGFLGIRKTAVAATAAYAIINQKKSLSARDNLQISQNLSATTLEAVQGGLRVYVLSKRGSVAIF